MYDCSCFRALTTNNYQHTVAVICYICGYQNAKLNSLSQRQIIFNQKCLGNWQELATDTQIQISIRTYSYSAIQGQRKIPNGNQDKCIACEWHK